LQQHGLGWQHILLAASVIAATIGLFQIVGHAPVDDVSRYPGSLFATVDVGGLSNWNDGAVAINRTNEIVRITDAGVQSLGKIEDDPVQVAAEGNQVVVSWRDPVRIAAYEVDGTLLRKMWSVPINDLDTIRGLTIAAGYVATVSPKTDELIILSLRDGRVAGRIETDPMPWDIAAWDDHLLVVIPGLKQLQVIDPDKQQTLKPLDIGIQPTSVYVRNSTAYVASVSGEMVGSVSLNDRRVTATTEIPGPSSAVAGLGDVVVIGTTGNDNSTIPYGVGYINLQGEEVAISQTSNYVSDAVAIKDKILIATDKTLVSMEAPNETVEQAAYISSESISWSPEGRGWLSPIISQVPLTSNDSETQITMTEYRWDNSYNDISIILRSVTCNTPGTAFGIITNIYTQWDTAATTGQSVLGAGVDHLFTVAKPQPICARMWAQDTSGYMMLVTGEGTIDEIINENSVQTLSFSAQLKGDMVSSGSLIQSVIRESISSPLAGYILIWICIRLIISVPRNRNSMLRESESTILSISVQSDLKTARYRRFLRRISYVLGIPSAVVLILSLTSYVLPQSSLNLTPFQWGFYTLFTISLFTLPWTRRRSSVERRSHRVWSKSSRGFFGTVIRVSAHALFIISIAGYAFGSIMLLFDPNIVAANHGAQGAAAFFDMLRVGLLNIVFVLGSTGMAWLFFLLSVLLYWANRLGQKLQAQGWKEERSLIGAYLYLRSYDEDELRLKATLRSGGPLGLLLPIRKIPFREVIATQLDRVVACDPKDKILPCIGTYRLEIDRKDWKSVIKEKASEAIAVIISCTPKSINEGFIEELEIVADIPHQRVILVVGPWKKDRQQRFQTFREAVSSAEFCSKIVNKSFYSSIVNTPIPEGAQILAHNPIRGWRIFGSEVQNDWSYALCLENAATWVNKDGNN
jgi:hypothetical protein